MSTNPSSITPYLLAAEVEALLRTKDDYLVSNRSSVALSALKMLYEELESSWQEWNTPSEEQQLQHASLSLEQKKQDWKESYTASKERLRHSNSRLSYLSQQQKLTLPQLIEQLMQQYSSEWQRSETSIEQLKENLRETRATWPAKKESIKQTLLSAYKKEQQHCEQQLQVKQTQLTNEQQRYERTGASTTDYAKRKQALADRKQRLAQQSSLLKQRWNEREEHEKNRNRLLAKQQTDLQQLTILKSKLLKESDFLLSEQNVLVQGCWLSENDLLPMDFSELSMLDSKHLANTK